MDDLQQLYISASIHRLYTPRHASDQLLAELDYPSRLARFPNLLFESTYTPKNIMTLHQLQHAPNVLYLV